MSKPGEPGYRPVPTPRTNVPSKVPPPAPAAPPPAPSIPPMTRDNTALSASNVKSSEPADRNALLDAITARPKLKKVYSNQQHLADQPLKVGGVVESRQNSGGVKPVQNVGGQKPGVVAPQIGGNIAADALRKFEEMKRKREEREKGPEIQGSDAGVIGKTSVADKSPVVQGDVEIPKRVPPPVAARRVNSSGPQLQTVAENSGVGNNRTQDTTANPKRLDLQGVTNVSTHTEGNTVAETDFGFGSESERDENYFADHTSAKNTTALEAAARKAAEDAFVADRQRNFAAVGLSEVDKGTTTGLGIRNAIGSLMLKPSIPSIPSSPEQEFHAIRERVKVSTAQDMKESRERVRASRKTSSGALTADPSVLTIADDVPPRQSFVVKSQTDIPGLENLPQPPEYLLNPANNKGITRVAQSMVPPPPPPPPLSVLQPIGGSGALKVPATSPASSKTDNKPNMSDVFAAIREGKQDLRHSDNKPTGGARKVTGIAAALLTKVPRSQVADSDSEHSDSEGWESDSDKKSQGQGKNIPDQVQRRASQIVRDEHRKSQSVGGSPDLSGTGSPDAGQQGRVF